MKAMLIYLTITLLCLNAEAEDRTFTSKDGREVRGELINYNQDSKQVTIRLSRGKEVITSAYKFSEESQDYFRSWAKKQPGTSLQRDDIKLSGFELSFPDGSSVIISLTGSITYITLEPGDIKKNSAGEIKSVGLAEVKRNNSGILKRTGSIYIQRDSSGRVNNIGGVEIKRNSQGKLKSIGLAEIKRDSSGTITSLYDNGESVRPTFLVISKHQ